MLVIFWTVFVFVFFFSLFFLILINLWNWFSALFLFFFSNLLKYIYIIIDRNLSMSFPCFNWVTKYLNPYSYKHELIYIAFRWKKKSVKIDVCIQIICRHHHFVENNLNNWTSQIHCQCSIDTTTNETDFHHFHFKFTKWWCDDCIDDDDCHDLHLSITLIC